jgi:hypothetical protein
MAISDRPLACVAINCDSTAARKQKRNIRSDQGRDDVTPAPRAASSWRSQVADFVEHYHADFDQACDG